MDKILKSLPYILTGIGTIAAAIASHNYAAAATGTFTIIQQLIAVWGVGAVAASSIVGGMVMHARSHAVASASLPVAPKNVDGEPIPDEDHLLGLLAQIYASKKDKRLEKLSQLFSATP